MVLGTPTYMSPEQARGKPVDRRTDIWAFGCVLYECLSGQRVFRGESFTDVLASIVGDEPDWSKLPELPPRVSELLMRALTKDPRERLRDIGEARMQLALASSDSPIASSGPKSGPSRSRSRRSAPLGAALLVTGAAGGWLTARLTESPASTAPTDVASTEARDMKVVLHTFEEGERFDDATLSPTAEHVAWRTRDGLYVRDLDELEPRRVHSTRLESYAWSPDGTELAFSADKSLLRVSVEGGAAVRITRHRHRMSRVCWSGDDVYFLADNDVYSIPAKGGSIELRAACGEKVSDLHGFGVLPAGAGVVAAVHWIESSVADTIGRYEDGEWIPLYTAPEDNLVFEGARPNGSIVFRRFSDFGSLWELPPGDEGEEAGRARVMGSERAAISLANDGTAIYVAHDNDDEGPAAAQPSWFQFDGTTTPVGEARRGVYSPTLSSDGGRILYSSFAEGSLQVWVHDVERGIATLLLSQKEPGLSRLMPDDRIAFSNPHSGTLAYAPSGKGDPEPLSDMFLKYASDDGSVWVWEEVLDGGLLWSRKEDGSDPSPLLETENEETFCDLSSDGAWMLYSSERAGPTQVYLSRFPPGEDEDWPVSAKGATRAWFLDDLSAIVFVDDEEPAGAFRVTFATDPDVEVKLGVPELLFRAQPEERMSDFDGVDRFLGTTREPPGRRSLVLTTEWQEPRR